MRVKYSAFSEPCDRSNEDTIVVKCDHESNKGLFMVCDGMGGLYRGDLASQIVGDVFSTVWEENHCIKSSSWMISHALEKAKESLDEMSRYNAGTTMVLAILDGDDVTIAHLGDSKVFYYRPGNGMLYESSDHVSINEEGWSYVSKGIFNFRPLERPDIIELKASRGDKILLCSDGVTNCFESWRMAKLLQEDLSPSSSLSELKAFCNTYARDNYSSIMVELL